ncbi:hypothetical protein [Chryseobacterium gossypii]|uniref:hypothetical protein n=1 Tax=Chryseobacterium gossypii TaxID=3231602 RepID=UPI003523BF5B
MKRIIFVLLLICSLFLTAQSADQKKIHEDASSFVALMKNKDYEGIMELAHPAIFEKADKQTLINIFKSVLEGNGDYKMEVADVSADAFKVSDIFNTKENGKYAFVMYPFKMRMSFLKEKFDDEKKKMMTNMMEVQGMKSKFIDDSTVEISKESMIIAVKDKTTHNLWKYINYDNNNALFASIVPVEIMKAAKEYYGDFLIKQKENAN